MFTRRTVLLGLGAVAIGGTSAAMFSGAAPAAAEGPLVEVWKSPYCGCCGGWIDHMRDNGFILKVHDVEDLDAIRLAKGVPPQLASCHTAVVDGYVVEGHVPAADVRRLLAERPKALGLTIPGMPQDAPGMDMKTGEPYEVLLFEKSGRTRLFARHG